MKTFTDKLGRVWARTQSDVYECATKSFGLVDQGRLVLSCDRLEDGSLAPPVWEPGPPPYVKEIVAALGSPWFVVW